MRCDLYRAAVAAAALAIGSMARGGLTDDFESYSPGSIGGQGNWVIGGAPGAGDSANVVTSPAPLAGAQSLLITDTSSAGPNNFIEARRNVLPSETESDGVTLSLAVKPLQASQPGVSGLEITPRRSGWDGSNYQFSEIARNLIYFQGDSGKILVENIATGIDTTIYTGWQANTWYRVDLTTHIIGGEGGTFLLDASVTDIATNTLLGSASGIDGGSVSSRTHISGIVINTNSATTGQYQVDSVSLLVPEPASLGALGAAALLLRRRRQ